MDFEHAFTWASRLVLLGWLLLVFVPRWRWSAPFVAGWLIPAILAIAYMALFIGYFRSAPAGFDAFGTLAGVKSLFQFDPLLLAGWIHYLCFDLFIGAWEVRDAQRLGVPHLLVIPCLLLTFMLGPIGLLAYFFLRLALRRRASVEETAVDAVARA